jgi:hypothetical protein
MDALEADENNTTAKDILSMVWETALLSSGFTLSDPATFSSRINRMVAVALEVTDQLEELLREGDGSTGCQESPRSPAISSCALFD